LPELLPCLYLGVLFWSFNQTCLAHPGLPQSPFLTIFSPAVPKLNSFSSLPPPVIVFFASCSRFFRSPLSRPAYYRFFFGYLGSLTSPWSFFERDPPFPPSHANTYLLPAGPVFPLCPFLTVPPLSFQSSLYFVRRPTLAFGLFRAMAISAGLSSRLKSCLPVSPPLVELNGSLCTPWLLRAVWRKCLDSFQTNRPFGSTKMFRIMLCVVSPVLRFRVFTCKSLFDHGTPPAPYFLNSFGAPHLVSYVLPHTLRVSFLSLTFLPSTSHLWPRGLHL